MDFPDLIHTLVNLVNKGDIIRFNEQDVNMVNEHIIFGEKIISDKPYRVTVADNDESMNIALFINETEDPPISVTDIIISYFVKYTDQHTITLQNYPISVYLDTDLGIIGLEDALKYYIDQPDIIICVILSIQNKFSLEEIYDIFTLLVKYSQYINVCVNIGDDEIYDKLVNCLIAYNDMIALSTLVKFLTDSARPDLCYKDKIEYISDILALPPKAV